MFFNDIKVFQHEVNKKYIFKNICISGNAHMKLFCVITLHILRYVTVLRFFLSRMFRKRCYVTSILKFNLSI